MSRILLIAYPPPQLIPGAKIEAAHYRSWQFLEPLVEQRHEILLCAGARGDKAPSSTVPSCWSTNLNCQPIEFGQPGWVARLQAAHDRFQPDCVVAVNFSHCLYATKLHTDKPIWMDIYGDMLSIMQASFYRAQSDRGLGTSIGFMREVLRKGDIFSVCSELQKHMTVGELAMAGRLNRHTFGYDFVRVVLPGSPPGADGSAKRVSKRKLLEPHGISNDDFVVLWCGGYNTWTDVETLFLGLQEAMETEPRLRYVSVGASTYEGVDNTYARFQKSIAGSRHRGRFVLLGWRPWDEIAGFYRESDLGINIDAMHYETIYGTRTRLTEMIASGLPVITTKGPELSYLLEEHCAGLTFGVGDWKAMGKQLLEAARDHRQRDGYAQRALALARGLLSFKATTEPLQHWVTTPTPAPDRKPLNLQDRLRSVEYGLRATVRHALWRLRGLDK